MYLDSGSGPGQPRKYKNPIRISALLDGENVKLMDEIRWRERKSFNELLNKAISEYIKNHSEGNDAFKLDKWQEDPEFKAIPTLLSDPDKWFKYISECNDSELTKIGLMSNKIHKFVGMRRTKEFKQKNRTILH